MDDEFEFMVTPLLFDMSLKLDAKGSKWSIEKVFGAPEGKEWNEDGGEFLHIGTLFPSKTTKKGVKGGVVLIKLKPANSGTVEASVENSVNLTVTYENVNGDVSTSVSQLSLVRECSQDCFDGAAIQKAVLLARYGAVLQEWIRSDARMEWTRNGRCRNMKENLSPCEWEQSRGIYWDK